MRTTIGPDGELVIPLDLLRECGISPGDAVALSREDDRIVVRWAPERRPLKGRFASRPLTALLERERAEERSRGGLP